MPFTPRVFLDNPPSRYVATSSSSQPEDPPHQRNESSIFIPKGSAGCISGVTNSSSYQRIFAYVYEISDDKRPGPGEDSDIVLMVGNGDGDKPMESTDDGERLKLFGPWDRDVFIIVRSEHSDNGRSNTWMRSKVRDSVKDGKSGSKTVTIRSDDQYNDDGGDYNDSITTVCFAPKDFRSSPGKGQTAIFIPDGYSVQVSCVSGSLTRQRLTIADSHDKTYAQFDEMRKNPDNGVSKGPMTSGGKRAVTLGPYDAHTWLVATYEGDSSGWNANITVGSHTGSQIVYTVGGEDREAKTSMANDLLATFILSPV